MIYVNKKDIQFEHAAGTKVFVYPQKEDGAKLYDFVTQELQITANRIIKPKNYHCTVVYSKNGCPGAEGHNVELPMHGSITEWKIWNTQFGRCLVGVINSDKIKKLNHDIRTIYGATSDFDEYIPHVTVAWDFLGDMPTETPSFNITFDAYKVGGIDPNWTPSQL